MVRVTMPALLRNSTSGVPSPFTARVSRGRPAGSRSTKATLPSADRPNQARWAAVAPDLTSNASRAEPGGMSRARVTPSMFSGMSGRSLTTSPAVVNAVFATNQLNCLVLMVSIEG